jgi:hypothetical protein
VFLFVAILPSFIPIPGMGGAVSGPLVILIGLQMLCCLRARGCRLHRPPRAEARHHAPLPRPHRPAAAAPGQDAETAPAAAADPLPAHAFTGLLLVLLGICCRCRFRSPTSCSASSCCCSRWRCWNAMAR